MTNTRPGARRQRRARAERGCRMTTTDDWRTMESGLDLDCLIAEATGLKVERSGEGEYPNFTSDREWVAAWHYVNGEVYGIKSYSADLNAAITLFEALPDDCVPRLVRLLQPMGDHMGHIWKAGIIINDELRADIDSEAPDPALAICRAWLAWNASAAPEEVSL